MDVAEWRSFDYDCDHCGAVAEVFTTSGKDNCAYDGDAARCADCGCPGQVVVDDSGNDDVVAEIQWHGEPNCECDWCKAHPAE